jgi:hypothetical protein
MHHTDGEGACNFIIFPYSLESTMIIYGKCKMHDKCNVYKDGVDPYGKCEQCISDCYGRDEFMHHTDGERACNFPLFTRKHDDNLGKVQKTRGHA